MYVVYKYFRAISMFRSVLLLLMHPDANVLYSIIVQECSLVSYCDFFGSKFARNDF